MEKSISEGTACAKVRRWEVTSRGRVWRGATWYWPLGSMIKEFGPWRVLGRPDKTCTVEISIRLCMTVGLKKNQENLTIYFYLLVIWWHSIYLLLICIYVFCDHILWYYQIYEDLLFFFLNRSHSEYTEYTCFTENNFRLWIFSLNIIVK